ncbi:MAG: DsbA family protein [Caulobacter sp.]|nr:DsbA family protein [Caulobacter sp.]
MRRLPILVIMATAGLLALTGCKKSETPPTEPAAALAPTVKVDKAFGDKVRAYLLQNPQVLLEVSQALQAKQFAESEAAAEAGRRKIPMFRARLERDPRDFVANPNGRVTVVEFYDYNCTYCKVIAPEVMALIRQHPEVRFVFKDFTLGSFGPTSEYAAAAAKALRDKGLFLDGHQEMMARKPLTDEMVDDLLKRNGISPAGVRTFEQTPDQKKYLDDVRTLAGDIGLDGTPAFVIGDTVVPGADPERLRAAIASALAGR